MRLRFNFISFDYENNFILIKFMLSNSISYMKESSLFGNDNKFRVGRSKKKLSVSLSFKGARRERCKQGCELEDALNDVS